MSCMACEEWNVKGWHLDIHEMHSLIFSLFQTRVDPRKG